MAPPGEHRAAGPFVEPARVLVDGRNVQRAMERASAPGSLPTSMLIARLRAAFPSPTEVELVLDGHRGGGPAGRVAPAFAVTFSRDATADAVIAGRVTELARQLGPAGAWSILVVSDDREVQAQAHRLGARAEGTAWLSARMAAPPSRSTPALGHGRPPRGPKVG
jgi:hypothetical protein